MKQIWAGFQSFLKAAESKTCNGLPDGMVVTLSGSIGAGLGVAGSGELVFNFNTGQVSAFAAANFQEGYILPVPAAGVQSGFIWGLGQSNSSYSGPFTSVAVGAGVVSATLAASSQGLKNPFDLSKPIVAAAGLQTPGVTFAYGTAYYTNPLNVGNLNSTVYQLMFPDMYKYMQDYQKLCGTK